MSLLTTCQTPQKLWSEGISPFAKNLTLINPSPEKIADEDKIVLTKTAQPTKFSRKSLDC